MNETNYKLMRKMVLLNLKRPLYRKLLANELGVLQTYKGFIDTINTLIENNIIKEKIELPNTRFLIINLKLLENYIRENSEEFKAWEEFIDKTTIGYGLLK